jgi:hypothetical protein
MLKITLTIQGSCLLQKGMIENFHDTISRE